MKKRNSHTKITYEKNTMVMLAKQCSRHKRMIAHSQLNAQCSLWSVAITFNSCILFYRLLACLPACLFSAIPFSFKCNEYSRLFATYNWIACRTLMHTFMRGTTFDATSEPNKQTNKLCPNWSAHEQCIWCCSTIRWPFNKIIAV